MHHALSEGPVKQAVKRKVRKVQRTLGQSLRLLRKPEVAVVCHDNPIAEAQADPIARSCERAIALVDGELSRRIFARVSVRNRLILLQSHWTAPPEECLRFIERLRNDRPDCRIAFLDWYAPVHIPHPEVLEAVDLYVKKQALSDRRRYVEGMYDTNLVEYEARWRERFRDTRFLRINAEQLEQKLFVGWNFATDRRRIKQLERKLYQNTDRPVDVHCRMCAPEERSTWYTHMRGRAYDAVQALRASGRCEGRVLCENKVIGYDEYIGEIARSKLCFSPFGYGEVCWRDFEAILAGALLIKPSMSHIVTHPNIYVPYETYVPVRWDFSDLEAQCMRYLDDESERRRITANAVTVWRDFLSRGWPNLWREMAARLSIEPPATRALA